MARARLSPREGDARKAFLLSATAGARAGGRFDEAAVLAAIEGRRDVAAHGPRGMTVWGRLFDPDRSGRAMPVYRVIGDPRALVDYLRSLQRP